MVLGACELLDAVALTPIDITVRNLCTGPNNTVRVYINDSYRGSVTYSQTFTGIRTGLVRLRAIGTGYGGATITGTYNIYVDSIWTLCPSSGGGGGTLSFDPDAVNDELRPLTDEDEIDERTTEWRAGRSKATL